MFYFHLCKPGEQQIPLLQYRHWKYKDIRDLHQPPVTVSVTFTVTVLLDAAVEFVVMGAGKKGGNIIGLSSPRIMTITRSPSGRS